MHEIKDMIIKKSPNIEISLKMQKFKQDFKKYYKIKNH